MRIISEEQSGVKSQGTKQADGIREVMRAVNAARTGRLIDDSEGQIYSWDLAILT